MYQLLGSVVRGLPGSGGSCPASRNLVGQATTGLGQRPKCNPQSMISTEGTCFSGHPKVEKPVVRGPSVFDTRLNKYGEINAGVMHCAKHIYFCRKKYLMSIVVTTQYRCSEISKWKPSVKGWPLLKRSKSIHCVSLDSPEAR